ncbi:MAG: ADP-ribosylation factor-directed GTPase activating protein isoform b [Pirellulaceae bacterium]
MISEFVLAPRQWLGLVVIFVVFAAAGCEHAPTVAAPAPLPSDDELRQSLDDAIDFTRQKRRLDVKDQAAWQIIHGALAYKRDFPVLVDGQDVSAVDYVLQGGQMNGWNLARGDLLDEKTGRYGVRALYEPGTKTGQGHYDQWMGYLSDAGLKLDEPVMVEGKPHTVEDYILQIERDVPRVSNREYTWTLMALTAFRPTSYEWTASDGEKWSIEKLVDIELEYETDNGPCGGTHRMYALALARNRHLAGGGKLEGIWQEVQQKIDFEVDRAKAAQNADGSLSPHYFQRPGMVADITEWMASSGHVFEFLAEALGKEQLEEEWMKRAAAKLCSQFKATKPIDVECAKLFHAAHGLVLYREKVFGPRTDAGN